MKAGWTKRTLNFKQPAGTSRGVMKTRNLWYITISENGKTGIGECAPLPGLSLDNIDQIESKLDEVSKFIHQRSFNFKRIPIHPIRIRNGRVGFTEWW